MAGRALTLLLALLPAAASAYSNSHPVLAWSSRHSTALSLVQRQQLDSNTLAHAQSTPVIEQRQKLNDNSLAHAHSTPAIVHREKAHSNTLAHAQPTPIITQRDAKPDTLAHALYTREDICEHDAVVVIDHPGLHASDLRALEPSSPISKSLSSAPSSLKLAYVESGDHHTNPFSDLADDLAKRCGSRFVSLAPDLGSLEVDAGKGRHVVSISLPALEDGEDGASRKSNMAESQSWLSGELTKIEAAFANYLVIYSGSPASLLHARQSTGSSSTFDAAAAPPDPTASGGILKRYQLLTPGLILALLVALFVLLPVIFLGVTALASIQSPLSNDIPKGFSAEEKKNQ